MKENKIQRWTVNNGSQIIGPFDHKEIAKRLFIQELDFENECWEECTGTSSQIQNAKIFSGSESLNDHLWIYDQETIHGPVSQGFLKTALSRQAISDSFWICEKSTINGWTQIKNFKINLKHPQVSPEAQSNKDVLEKIVSKDLDKKSET